MSEPDVSELGAVIRCIDLTSLEGRETATDIEALCAKAIHPDPDDPSVPSVAAVCIESRFVPVAAEHLRGSRVRVAAVAGGFPSGDGPLTDRLQEIDAAVAAGADEVDVVLNRHLFLSGRHDETARELQSMREAAGPTVLKVILETGELGSDERIRQASMLAMVAGADFIKTSTGKVAVNATIPAARCMAEAVRDFMSERGRVVGIKVAGGIRRASQALEYQSVVRDTLGSEWLVPERFRIGASSLLDEVLEEMRTGDV
jgi:deoxyribose-phosphate aldolase